MIAMINAMTRLNTAETYEWQKKLKGLYLYWSQNNRGTILLGVYC